MMAPQQNTFATLRKVQPAPMDAQERIGTWLYRNYFYECCASTEVRTSLVLTKDEFIEKYLAAASEPERTSRSESLKSPGGVMLEGAEQAARQAPRAWLKKALDLYVPKVARPACESESTDTSTSRESDYSWGLRSPRQPKSLPEVLSAQPERNETGSGYEADVSDNARSSRVSSVASSDALSARYMPLPSSSMSSEAQHTPDAGSSDSSDADSSDSDWEARDISCRFDAITREHHEQMEDLLARAEDSSVEATLQTPLSPVVLNAPTVHEQLAELERDIHAAREELHTRALHSYGEYRAELMRCQAVERERLAQVGRDMALERQALDTRASHSWGEYKAEVAGLKALDRQRLELQQQIERFQ